MTKPELADLWTTTDIGRRLGITRAGAALLPQANSDFPPPIGKLGHYTLWWRPEVESWIVERRSEVKPGTLARKKNHSRGTRKAKRAGRTNLATSVRSLGNGGPSTIR